MKQGGNNNLPGERKAGAMNPDIVSLRDYELLFIEGLSQGLAISDAAIAVREKFPDIPFSDSTARNLAKKPHIVKTLSTINGEVNREIASVRTEKVRSILPEFTKRTNEMLLDAMVGCEEGLDAMRELLASDKVGSTGKTEAMKQIISLTQMLIKHSGIMETETTEVSKERSVSQGINHELFSGILEGVLGVKMKSAKVEEDETHEPVEEAVGDSGVEAAEF